MVGAAFIPEKTSITVDAGMQISPSMAVFIQLYLETPWGLRRELYDIIISLSSLVEIPFR